MSAGNGSDDDDTQPGVPIGHDGNRALLTVIGNLLLEAKEHARGLETLYTALRSLVQPAPTLWAHQLLYEFERHHEKTDDNLRTLRTIAK